MIEGSALNGGKNSDWLRPFPCALSHPALNAQKASDWLRPFPTCGRVANYQMVRTSQAIGTLMEYTCWVLRLHPLDLREEPDHISSQEKEAVLPLHDIYIYCKSWFGLHLEGLHWCCCCCCVSWDIVVNQLYVYRVHKARKWTIDVFWPSFLAI